MLQRQQHSFHHRSNTQNNESNLALLGSHSKTESEQEAEKRDELDLINSQAEKTHRQRLASFSFSSFKSLFSPSEEEKPHKLEDKTIEPPLEEPLVPIKETPPTAGEQIQIKVSQSPAYGSSNTSINLLNVDKQPHNDKNPPLSEPLLRRKTPSHPLEVLSPEDNTSQDPFSHCQYQSTLTAKSMVELSKQEKEIENKKELTSIKSNPTPSKPANEEQELTLGEALHTFI